jgi:hypothetical protein
MNRESLRQGMFDAFGGENALKERRLAKSTAEYFEPEQVN